MTDSGSWDVISGAGSSRIILSVDFPVMRRRDAGLAELVTKMGPEYRFLQTKMPVSGTAQRASGAAHVNRWIDDIQDHPVLAVLGNRVGGVYAAAIAEELSRWQQAPRVILFNPQCASTRLLGYELHREVSAITSLLSDDEIERAGKLAEEITGSQSGHVADTAAAVTGFYWEICSAAFERAGLGGAYCSRSFAAFESYLSLVCAAGQIDPSRAWKHSTAIVSSDYATLPNGPPTGAGTSGLIGRSLPFDVPHTDLLRSESVAKTVLGLLELN